MDAMKVFTEGLLKKEPPVFNIGDTVRVSVRIKEGERERIQAFEGTVIAKKHGGISETFTVRRTSYGVGVERVFRCTLRLWRRSRSCARVKFAAPSCSICAGAPARPPRSRKSFDKLRKGRMQILPFLYIRRQKQAAGHEGCV